MKQIKPRKLTKKEIQAIVTSPSIVKKKKEAEDLFNSPKFKKHILEKTAGKRLSSKSVKHQAA